MSDPERQDGPAGAPRSPGQSHNGPFPVVGIGASAGGLEAVSRLFAHLPDVVGMAFVLVQHLDPDRESKLVELLAKTSRLPVAEATHGLEIESDNIYIILPNTSLTVVGGVLQTEARPQARGPHLPIDHFFKSLADDQQANAIGVVLSGTGSDGTLGVQEIKAAGGFTFAQDEESARFPSMPLYAARSGCVDLVLPPEEIARELVRIGRHPIVADGRDTRREPEPDEEDQFRRVLEILRIATGVDFAAYRDSTVRRRIMRRVVLRTGMGLADYAEHLQREPQELDALYHDILINVTSFFRDEEGFEALKRVAFPELLKGRDPNASIRAWVAGCSTGQEAYSLAISLLEFLEDKPVRPPIQIFATDLSDAVSLRWARVGVYPRNIETQLSPERLRRYFIKTDDHYRISKTIRDMCVFAKHDVASDPPFSRIDLVCCRNLLIYLGGPLQKRVIPIFHYALNPVGFLWLGPSETVGAHSDLFAVADQRHRIYVKRTVSGRPYPQLAIEAFRRAAGAVGPGPHAPPTVDWQREADRVALGEYAPPGVLLTGDLDILQFRGQTGTYLRPASGEPSFNLLKMAREGLYLEVRRAVEESRQGGIRVRRQGIPIDDGGRIYEIDLCVLPVRSAGVVDVCFLVYFEESAKPQQLESETTSSDVVRPAEARAAAELSRELASTREYIQSLIEKHDAANEELRVANEEILSSNEELQSTNEEMETAKEELQSLNEELLTVNEQLQQGNRDLSRLNDDLANLLGSAGVPMLVLGIDLCIRRFTPAAVKTLNLVPEDVGRPVGRIRLAVDLPDLEALAAEVIDSVRPVEREVRGSDGRWYALRIHPYRTADNKIDGAVVVLLDIQEIKQIGQRLQEANEFTRAVVETVRESLLVLDHEMRVLTANRSFYRTFQVQAAETEGRLLYELGNHQWDIPRLRVLLEEVLPRQTTIEGYEVSHDFEMIGPKTMVLNARRIVDGHGPGPGLILMAIEDVTETKQVEESLHRSEERSRLLLENVTDYAVFFMDSEGCVVGWDEGAARAFGYRIEEISGRPLSVFFTPEDVDRGLPVRELRVAQQQGRSSDDNWLVRKDGSRFWASGVTTALRDEAGGLRGFVKIVRDMTEWRRAEEALRESEHRLKVALSAAQMGTWHWEIPANRQILDENLSRLCGLQPHEVVRTLEDFLRTIHPEDRLAVATAFARSVEEGVNFDVEFRVAWPDGTVRWLKDQGDVFHDEDGRPLYMTGACVDITYRKRAEEELRQARDELELRVQERTGELLAANSSLEEQFTQRGELLQRLATAEENERRRISRELHDEMGQYLTALILELKLLGDALPEESPARGRLDRLQQVTSDIGSEVHRLAVELRPTSLDDVGLPKTIQNYLDEWSERTGVRSDFHAAGFDARPPTEVETTVYRLAQEALTNVAKHAGAGQVSVILECRDEHVTLIIEDDGRGFNVEAALAARSEMPRLGLLGMRERVAMAGGTLTIESSPGGPTTLFARVPIEGNRERDRDA